MAPERVARRSYAAPSVQLFGACLTALGQLRATIERQDVERGVIVASIGRGGLAPVSQLSLVLQPQDDRRTELVATWRALRRGGDRRLLTLFLDSVDVLLG